MALSGKFSGGEVGSDMHCELEFCHVLNLSLKSDERTCTLY